MLPVSFWETSALVVCPKARIPIDTRTHVS